MQKLLLADDSVTIQRVIELTFSGEDIQVVAVNDGEQAIARIPTEHPDIVLADIGMPKKGGYDVAAFVKGRADLEHIPVLLLAGAFEPVDQARAEQVRCDGVLIKPFEPRQVIERVRELLEGVKGSPAQATADVLRPVERISPQPVPVVPSVAAVAVQAAVAAGAGRDPAHGRGAAARRGNRASVPERPDARRVLREPELGLRKRGACRPGGRGRLRPAGVRDGTAATRRRAGSREPRQCAGWCRPPAWRLAGRLFRSPEHGVRSREAHRHATPAARRVRRAARGAARAERGRARRYAEAARRQRSRQRQRGAGRAASGQRPRVCRAAQPDRRGARGAAPIARRCGAARQASPPCPGWPTWPCGTNGAPVRGELADAITERVLERLVPEITATVQRLVQEEVDRIRKHH